MRSSSARTPLKSNTRCFSIAKRSRWCAIIATVALQIALVAVAGRMRMERPEAAVEVSTGTIRMVLRVRTAPAAQAVRPPDVPPAAQTPERPKPARPPRPAAPVETPPREQPAETEQDALFAQHDPDRPPQEATGPSESLMPPHSADYEAERANALLAALLEVIEKHKSYPRAARRARLQGVVTIKVSIDRSARIAGFALLEGSGHHLLDSATEETFRKISGTRLASDDLERPIHIVVPVRYEHI